MKSQSNRRITFILLLIICLIQLQAKDIYFKHLSTTDGLSQPSAISIWQDRLGNMWFGNNLLNRYNGNSIKTFRISNYIEDIQDSNIKHICGDSKTTMYVLVNNELICYDYFSDKFSNMNINADDIFISNDVLYYTWKNHVFRYDSKQNQSINLLELSTNIKYILLYDEQNYWIGADDGVYNIINGQKHKILSESNISCLFKDSSNNIWVGTRDNGVQVIKMTGRIVNLRDEISAIEEKEKLLNRIRTIKEDNNGNIWIGTYHGIVVFSPINKSAYLLSNSETKPYSLRNNSVFSIYKDKQGTMWIGTYYGGVSYFNPDIELYTYYGTSKSDKNLLNGLIIGEMVENNEGDLFIATEEGGLNILHRKNQMITRYDNTNSIMPHNTIKSLWYDSKRNKLYIGTFTEGLVVYNHQNKQLKRIGQNILKTFGQKIISQIIPYKDYLLISTQDGLYKLNCDTDELSNFSDNNIFSKSNLGFIHTMCLDEENLLWLYSVENGLFNINLNTNKVSRFEQIETIIKKNPIGKIKSDEKGKIYFLTNGSGVIVYDKRTNNFITYKKEANDMLLSDICYNLAFTLTGKVVITSDKGITLFTPNENKSIHLKIGEIFPLNAIFSSCGLFVSPSDGQIFIGGVSGMLSLSEKEIFTMSTSSKSYKLHFSSLAINNNAVNSVTHPNILKENIAYTKKITLNHEQNNISIGFASSDYIHPNNTKYEYMLEGYDLQWTTTSDKTIRYTSLPSGKYNLTVRDFNDKMQSLHIDLIIQPPFYRSVWAYIIYTIIGLLILFYIIRSAQRNMMLKATLKMEHREKVRMEELNSMKNNFFTNISHEFRTPLTLILSHLDMTLNSENITSSTKSRLLKIKKHTKNMQDLISELNDLRKSEEGVLSLQVKYKDICIFINEIYSSFKDYALIRHIDYTIELPSDKIELWFDPYLLQKVIHNLFSNAFKFTDDFGKISVVLKESKSYIEININDTGLGISNNDLEKIFERFYQVEQREITKRIEGMGIGLALCKSIVELHHGEILVSSEPNIGTSFTVKLQLGGLHFQESQKKHSINRIKDVSQFPSFESEQEESLVENVINDNQKSNILIIEDNEDLLQLLIEAFTPIYKVDFATNGEDGLNKAKEQLPDIILTDIMIPKFSGLEVCKHLKSHIETSHIPIILITALASTEQNIEGLKQGADDYITKPFDLEILLLKCNNLVRSRKTLQYKFQNEYSPETIGLATNILDQKILDKSITYIENNLSNEKFDINQWAKELNMGRTKLFNKIKGITGLTPNEFVLNIKMKKAASLLKNSPDMTISEIAYQLGFSSSGYFGKCFKELYGVTPFNYRNN